MDATDCPPTGSVCVYATCNGNKCGVENVADGVQMGPQFAGDCQRVVCDGQGGTRTVADPTDPEDDQLDCTLDQCDNLITLHVPVQPGNACDDNGGVMCNAVGQCVTCLAPTDCPVTGHECITATCTSGVCGTTHVADGVATVAQVTGDCQKTVCNGQGSTRQENDDADAEDDNNDCTLDACNTGTPTHDPEPLNHACGATTNLFCDGQGHCVGCVNPDDCEGTDDTCKSRTCDQGQCGVTYALIGTELPPANQTSGDCRTAVCDGQGSVTWQANDPDVFDDSNGCTVDTCTAGTPHHDNAQAGASCTDHGGHVCNNSGACVECNGPTDCTGQDTDCAERTCINSTCGWDYALDLTPTTDTLAGDCQATVCNGLGGTRSITDNSDLPVDNNPCTEDLCTNGTPSNPDKPTTATCAENGGRVCNGAGSCVECNVPADCPDTSTECHVVTCTANTCGATNPGQGTVVTDQAPGNCHNTVCNGNGSTEEAINNLDIPADGKQCTHDVCTNGVPSNPFADTTATCDESGGAVCDGAGTCVMCNDVDDCGGPGTECLLIACTNHLCQPTNVGPGTVVTDAVPGNCQDTVCDGNGSMTEAINNADLPVDGKQCTSDVCTNGTPSNPNLGTTTACTENGGRVCNGNGACVACNLPADCPDTSTACHIVTCLSNTCGATNPGSGTVITDQVPGNCHHNECDGIGGIQEIINNTDLPVDGKQCTDDVCTNGVPSNPNLGMTATCSENGGAVCDGAGTCVQCNNVTHCGGPGTQCNIIACTNHVCEITKPAQGTVVTDLAPGNCQDTVCNGAGGTEEAINNTDLPVDGNQCTGDVCTNGAPSNPSLDTTATCNQSGGDYCDGAGSCVECNVPAQCTAVVPECKVAVCNSHVCGLENAVTGTVLATQTTGDCKQRQCDASGNPVVVEFNSDLPVDGNQCTDDVCTAGVASNPNVASGTLCNQDGGRVCNGVGACVHCVEDSHCATEGGGKCNVTTWTCEAPTCTDGLLNQGETEIDCGGPNCPICSTVLLVGTGTDGTWLGTFKPGQTWNVVSQASEKSPSAPAVTLMDNGIAVGVLRQDVTNAVRYTTWTNGTWTTFADVGIGATTRAAPSISADGNVAHLCFQEGTFYRHQYSQFQTTWSAVEDVGPDGSESYGPTAASIAAMGLDAMVVFFDGSSTPVNQLYARSRVAGIWEPKEGPISTDNNHGSSPAVVAMTAGPIVMVVFRRDANSQLYWATDVSLPAPIASATSPTTPALAALPSGQAVVAFRGDNGKPYAVFYDGSAWGTPVLVVDAIISGVPSVTHGVDTAKAEIAFVGTDGAAYHARHISGTWTVPVAVGGTNLVGVSITSGP